MGVGKGGSVGIGRKPKASLLPEPSLEHATTNTASTSVTATRISRDRQVFMIDQYDVSGGVLVLLLRSEHLDHRVPARLAADVRLRLPLPPACQHAEHATARDAEL